MHRVKPVWRPIPFALAAAALFAMRRGVDVDANAPSRSAALAQVLRARGLSCDADDVTWVRGPRGVRGALTGGARALVRASKGGDPADLYFVDARLSPEGTLLDVGSEHDLTHTIGVDEARPLVRGHFAAYAATIDGTVTGVHTLDLTGRPPETYTEFTRMQRWQTGMTNRQKTGQPTGVVHAAYALDPIATDVQIAWASDDTLSIRADGRTITVDAPHGVPVDGAGWVRVALEEKARPPTFAPWMSERLRETPWIGDEKTMYLKAIAFTLKQWIPGLSGETSNVAEDLGAVNSGQQQPASFVDPEIGWPPPPIKPLLTPALPNEGQWITLDKDPFITHVEGAPPAFVTSFIRSEKSRPATRIYLTMWDPRQIALHMEAGTVEPVSATGEAGPGVIPRTPEVLRRVVAGFNGGFQAIHGEFGMQVNGINYLPPKPYAATIMEMRDGSTAMGTWPAASDVPDEVLSYRQNLTALVEGDKWNPYQRLWWGGTPKGWADNIHTTRSGVCLTKENHAAYFWGVDISAETLAGAMLLARCAYGVHLDMNPGLAGFEFYNVQPANTWQPLGRPVQTDWEYEGTFRELPEFKFRARRMIKGMQHQNFPQYIHRDGRDFFYLTQRPVLPGAELPSPIVPKLPNEGAWRLKGLPQHGFPYAMAIAQMRPDASRPDVKVRALRVDPRTVRPAGSAGTTAETPTVVSFVGGGKPPRPGEMALWLASGVFLLAPTPPDASATPLASGAAATGAGGGVAKTARVGVGVHDEDGMLEWVELAPEVKADESTSKLLDKLLEKAGCSSRMLVAGDARAMLGGTLDAAGDPAPPAGTTSTARLVRGAPPGAHPHFEDTKVVSPAVWQPLQNQRVRYFRKPPKEAPKDAGAPKPEDPGAPSGAGTHAGPPGGGPALNGDSRGTPGGPPPAPAPGSGPEPKK